MMLPLAVLRGVIDGRIDRAFRRWERARVKVGGRQRTALGVISFTSAEVVEREDLAVTDAERAGFASLERLLAVLDRRPERPIWRIGLEFAGPDPRATLRDTLPGPEELEGILRRLERLDAVSRDGPWTNDVLALIGARPNVRAVDLATSVGREKMPFKLDVRKLKELGLTESLRPGYRLSARGEFVLHRLTERR
ncbi:MAG TPA: hypothetical protein VFP30_03825 [Candidatus Limnocylindria bacterium]|nr:hypothetical protein [Candidatus Limnocylindria bacterium]